MKKSKIAVWFTAIFIGIILINILSTRLYKRIDLTKEGRFSLTEATETKLLDLEDVVYIKVYLEGEFPAGLKRLKNATKDMLDEFRSYTGNYLEYNFEDPLADAENDEEKIAITEALTQKGVIPERLIEQQDGYSETVFFPYALATYGGREYAIPLLERQLNRGPQETINESIALLEYKLANAIQKLQRPARENIAFIEGHGELSDIEVSSIANELSRFYNLSRVDITETSFISSRYDAIVVAKPTQKFEEFDKFELDQYIMNGGKVLWLVDNMIADIDSLNNSTGYFMSVSRDINLMDQLFKYGVRVNDNLIQDLQCNPIPLATSTSQAGNATQLNLFEWYYHPIISRSNNGHPISKNLGPISAEFASSIDTILTKGANIEKTYLLTSSQYTKTLFAPVKVDVSIVKNKAVPERFNKPHQPIAVALEGEFESPFKNRLAFNTQQMLDTLEDMSFKDKSVPTKMVVVSDGDIIRNDFDPLTQKPYMLGYYKYNKQTFDNKQFILNCIEWLLDDSDIMTARSKDVKLRLLDTERIKPNKLKWQLINIAIPLILLLVFGLVYNFIRKRRFAN